MNRRTPTDAARIARLVILLLCCGLLLATCLAPELAAPAQAQQAGDIRYMLEDFDDRRAQDWTLDNGCQFEEVSGNPRLYCAGHNSAMYPLGNWGERPFTLQFIFWRLSEGMHVNILTRDNPPGWDRYAVAIGADFNDPNNPILRVNLFKQVIDPPPPNSIYYGNAINYSPSIWYLVTIRFDGGRIQVYIDPFSRDGSGTPAAPEPQNLLLDYQDPQPLRPGGISFESINDNTVFIDSVEVWGPPPAPALRSASEPEPPAQPPPQPPAQPEPPREEGPQPAFDYPECPAGEVLYLAETFDQHLQSGWDLWQGWKVADGRLQGENHNWATYVEGNWKDYRLRMIAGLRQGRSGLHINTRLSEGNRYFFGWYTDFFHFSKQMNQKYQENIVSDQRAFDTSAWHSFEMSNFGSRIQVIIDGQVLVDWNDPNPLPAGPVGLETLDDGFFTVDALWVCGPRSGLPITPSITPTRTRTPTRYITPTRTRTPSQRAVGPVITPPGPGNPPKIPIDILILIGVITGGYVIYRWLRGRSPGKPEGPDKASQPPPLPGLPPVRLLNLWLTGGESSSGAALNPAKPLIAGQTYYLHAQLQTHLTKKEAKKVAATAGSPVPLEVVIYSPSEDFATEKPLALFTLPPGSESTIVTRPLRPLRPGASQVRVAVYYHNVLLQSAVVEMQVAPTRGRAGRLKARQPGLRRVIDYVAACRFAFLSELPHPALNIFTNQAPDGSHWIGLYSSDAQASPRLRQGDLHIFPADKLAHLARRLRDQLAKVEGEHVYRMDYSPPPDATILREREKDLIGLAVEGFRLYDELFLSIPDGLREERLRELQRLLHERSILSIARCRAASSTLPWAALYSFPIDPDQPERLGLCPAFKDQIARTQWQSSQPVSVLDNLDHPQVCQAQADCPLRGDQANRTICPFGFWGFMHQIEQPLQQVQPVETGQVPAEVSDIAFEQRAQLELPPGGQVRMVMAAYPGLPEVEDHRQELASLRPVSTLQFTYETRRDEVLKLLKEGGRHLYYFYCHGVLEDEVFKLMLGPLLQPGRISAAALDPFSIHWPEQPHPMFILNGCQTMALTPELIHGFMGKLRRLGASGLVGSEVKVWTLLARPFGTRLVADMLSGRSLGEAMLETRLNLLRQGNPLGLVYTLHAPVNLHLHAGDACPRCHPAQEAHA